MSSQHAFLARVREALHGHAASETPPQVSTPIEQLSDTTHPRVAPTHLALVERMQEELAAVGGKVERQHQHSRIAELSARAHDARTG